jgi:UDP-2-acetamido-3-amino-2,3-dideoxy-glucuronate N-acetyltransferase
MTQEGVFCHESSYVDQPCKIGAGTKIWHFSHVMKDCEIGENCNIGQNVVISPGVKLGERVKIQNNVSVYTGVVCEDDVFLGPSCVFTNVINPRSAVNRKEEYAQDVSKERSIYRGQRHHSLRSHARRVLLRRCRQCRNKRRRSLCT